MKETKGKEVHDAVFKRLLLGFAHEHGKDSPNGLSRVEDCIHRCEFGFLLRLVFDQRQTNDLNHRGEDFDGSGGDKLHSLCRFRVLELEVQGPGRG